MTESPSPLQNTVSVLFCSDTELGKKKGSLPCHVDDHQYTKSLPKDSFLPLKASNHEFLRAGVKFKHDTFELFIKLALMAQEAMVDNSGTKVIVEKLRDLVEKSIGPEQSFLKDELDTWGHDMVKCLDNSSTKTVTLVCAVIDFLFQRSDQVDTQIIRKFMQVENDVFDNEVSRREKALYFKVFTRNLDCLAYASAQYLKHIFEDTHWRGMSILDKLKFCDSTLKAQVYLENACQNVSMTPGFWLRLSKGFDAGVTKLQLNVLRRAVFKIAKHGESVKIPAMSPRDQQKTSLVESSGRSNTFEFCENQSLITCSNISHEDFAFLQQQEPNLSDGSRFCTFDDSRMHQISSLAKHPNPYVFWLVSEYVFAMFDELTRHSEEGHHTFCATNKEKELFTLALNSILDFTGIVSRERAEIIAVQLHRHRLNFKSKSNHQASINLEFLSYLTEDGFTGLAEYLEVWAKCTEACNLDCLEKVAQSKTNASNNFFFGKEKIISELELDLWSHCGYARDYAECLEIQLEEYTAALSIDFLTECTELLLKSINGLYTKLSLRIRLMTELSPFIREAALELRVLLLIMCHFQTFKTRSESKLCEVLTGESLTMLDGMSEKAKIYSRLLVLQGWKLWGANSLHNLWSIISQKGEPHKMETKLPHELTNYALHTAENIHSCVRILSQCEGGNLACDLIWQEAETNNMSEIVLHADTELLWALSNSGRKDVISSLTNSLRLTSSNVSPKTVTGNSLRYAKFAMDVLFLLVADISFTESISENNLLLTLLAESCIKFSKCEIGGSEQTRIDASLSSLMIRLTSYQRLPSCWYGRVSKCLDVMIRRTGATCSSLLREEVLSAHWTNPVLILRYALSDDSRDKCDLRRWISQRTVESAGIEENILRACGNILELILNDDEFETPLRNFESASHRLSAYTKVQQFLLRYLGLILRSSNRSTLFKLIQRLKHEKTQEDMHLLTQLLCSMVNWYSEWKNWPIFFANKDVPTDGTLEHNILTDDIPRDIKQNLEKFCLDFMVRTAECEKEVLTADEHIAKRVSRSGAYPERNSPSLEATRRIVVDAIRMRTSPVSGSGRFDQTHNPTILKSTRCIPQMGSPNIVCNISDQIDVGADEFVTEKEVTCTSSESIHTLGSAGIIGDSNLAFCSSNTGINCRNRDPCTPVKINTDGAVLGSPLAAQSRLCGAYMPILEDRHPSNILPHRIPIQRVSAASTISGELNPAHRADVDFDVIQDVISTLEVPSLPPLNSCSSIKNLDLFVLDDGDSVLGSSIDLQSLESCDKVELSCFTFQLFVEARSGSKRYMECAHLFLERERNNCEEGVEFDRFSEFTPLKRISLGPSGGFVCRFVSLTTFKREGNEPTFMSDASFGTS